MIDYAFQKRKLVEKHVKVQEEWIEACIQWLSTETENKNLSPYQLHGLVYEQWLMSDLREISVASLPKNISSTLDMGILEGIYNLQINYAFNIGVSAYSQLQKCKGLAVDDPPTEKNSRLGKGAVNSYKTTIKGGKTTRTLLFELTDGFQVIKAVEYISIPEIPDSITPGLKIQLKGSILCRNGILLISPDNISMLGGSAEDLVDEFSLTTIFNNMLSNGGDVKDGLASSTRTASGRKHKAGLKVQNIPESVTATAHPSNANFTDQDYEELLKDELLTIDEALTNELLEVEDPFNPDLLENEVKTSEVRNLKEEGADSCLDKRRETKLINLEEFLREKSPRKKLVKASIVTFLSKLDVQKVSYRLTICIDDRTAIAAVNISSHVLEKLLGIPPSELYEYKGRKSHPVPESIKQAILQCQQRLATRLWYMQLKKNENERTIEITEMTEV